VTALADGARLDGLELDEGEPMPCEQCAMVNALLVALVVASTDAVTNVAIVDPDRVMGATLRVIAFTLRQAYPKPRDLEMAIDDVGTWLRANSEEAHAMVAELDLVKQMDFVSADRLH
jgi:hypothetical protein